MTAISTSSFGDTWRALDRLLRTATWPTAPMVTPAPFAVATCAFGPPGPPDEYALIVTQTDQPRADWVSIGEQRRSDDFDTMVYVATHLPHRDPFAACARIEELVAVVERILHRTARPASHPAEFGGRLIRWSATSIDPQIVVTDKGLFGATCAIRVSVECRIKPTAP